MPAKQPHNPKRRSLLIQGALGLSLLSSGMLESKVSKNKQHSATNKRFLGKLQVSAIGLGVQNMPRKYDTSVPYRPEMVAIIRRAYETGVTFFDTAEAYGPLESEKILGEAVAPFRKKIVIATKFGFNVDPQTGKRSPGVNSKPEHIKQAVHHMLKRLRTDYIDLLYQHRVDPQVPIEDVAGVIADLIKQGKVLHWGLSEMGLQTLRRAHAALPVSAVQCEYSMLWRGPEEHILPLCEELGIGFVAWSPLGVQFLTGWIDSKTRFASGDFRATETRFNPENIAHNLKLVALLKTWAQRKNATPAQIALSWLLAKKPYIVPIPGTTNKDHMLQNTASLNVKLSASEMQELTQALDSIKIQGKRLPDFVQALSGVEAAPKH
ncbi:aldo/keto reductase [Helicobacter suis]|uniref:aldo/keto reductase n=1 Tax=Helicobacter suis TaxID=104628 RepID=UPI0013D01F92|nr:aldo/keto reductase [Helicobacter suis]